MTEFTRKVSTAIKMPPLTPKYQLATITGIMARDAISIPSRAWNNANITAYIPSDNALIAYGHIVDLT